MPARRSTRAHDARDLAALALRDEGLTPTAIARRLGFSRREDVSALFHRIDRDLAASEDAA